MNVNNPWIFKKRTWYPYLTFLIQNGFPFRDKPRTTEKRYIVSFSPAASHPEGFNIRLRDIQMCLQKLTRRHRGNHKVVSWVVSTVLNCKWTRASSLVLKTMTCHFCVGLPMKKDRFNIYTVKYCVPLRCYDVLYNTYTSIIQGLTLLETWRKLLK